MTYKRCSSQISDPKQSTRQWRAFKSAKMLTGHDLQLRYSLYLLVVDACSRREQRLQIDISGWLITVLIGKYVRNMSAEPEPDAAPPIITVAVVQPVNVSAHATILCRHYSLD
jgi:hypothetical protein